MVDIVIAVISIVAFAIIWTCLMRLIFEYKGDQDEIHLVRTEDGHLVTLYHFFPRQLNKDRPPVILCHGLGANHFTWDPGPVPGFARYVRDDGFDVWVIDLRGRGPGARLQQRRGEKSPGGWNFDDYVRYDLPAIINYVRDETGHDQVHWAGHSMGGMVIYAYLQTQDASAIRSATAVASPGIMKHYNLFRPFAGRTRKLLKRFTYIRWIPLAAFTAPFGYLAPAGRVGTPRNVYPWFAVNGVGNPSAAVLDQFLEWMQNETLRNADHSYNYSDGFDKITAPFLVVEGAGDWTAPPPDVRYGIDRMSSEDKKYAFFSKKNGAKFNYDHMSILLGHAAVEEVWPVMLEWLKTH